MERYSKLFVQTLAFLTRLPLPFKVKSSYPTTEMVVFFPLVGSCLGFLTACIYLFFGWIFSNPFIGAVCAVFFLKYLTGFLHDDGLADTFEAFLGGKNPEHVSNIMKDPRLGTYGVMILIFFFLLNISLIEGFSYGLSFIFLPIACAFGRLSSCFLLYFSSNTAPEKSLASRFTPISETQIYGAMLPCLFLWFILCLIKGFFLSLVFFIFLMASILGICWLMNHFSHKKLEHLNGDVFGACIHLCEIITLIFCAVIFQ